MTAPITPDAARELAAKATPGPWVADETDPADVVVWASRDFAHDDELIANIGHAIQPVNVAFDCDAANARLIAAAPTLATLYADQADELARVREENARLRRTVIAAGKLGQIIGFLGDDDDRIAAFIEGCGPELLGRASAALSGETP